MKFSVQLKLDSLFEFSAPEYDDRHISWILTDAQWRVFIQRYNPFADKYQQGFESTEQRRRDLEQLIKSATISGAGITGQITYTGVTTNTSKIITDLSSTVGMFPGIVITGAGIPVDTLIDQIISDTSISITKAATATSTILSPTTLTSGIGKSASQGGVHPNGIFLDLPSGFLYSIEEGCMLHSALKEAWIKPVKHDEYLPNINNPYKKPYKNLLWRMDYSRQTQAEGSAITATAKRTELILPPTYSLDYYRVRFLSVPPAIVCNEFDESDQRHCVLDESIHREIVDEAVSIAQAAIKQENYQVGLNEKQRSQ